MSKIYIVRAFGGSYDGAWETNLYAFLDEKQAAAEAERLTALHTFCVAKWPAVQAALQAGYAELRAFSSEPVAPHPKGHAKMTKDEQRQLEQQRRKWRKEADVVWARNRAITNALMLKATAAARDAAVAAGCTEEHLKEMGFFNDAGELSSPSFQTDTSYDYEELELK